jgi:unsaturated chondroitin disaccharide hydrolase
MRVDRRRAATDLLPKIQRLFELSGPKIDAIERTWKPEDGAPVFTVRGRYQARGWTEWTQGFQFGSALLQFDATGEPVHLDLGRSRTLERMAPHLTHVGVHDHGFNNVSTYGTLWRLAREGRIDASKWEAHFYELALKVSGAVQARRWTRLPDGGFIHSFNGAHSLFVDTIRSLRALALGHALGQRLMEEQDAGVSLLERLIHHARATAAFSVYFGRGRDRYDVRGRTAHESLFNVASGT